MSEYIIELPNGGAADECIRLRGYDKSLYGYELREEIVHCRDCKYMHMRYWFGTDVPECWLHADRESGALGKEPTDPDGFCKWGERK